MYFIIFLYYNLKDKYYYFKSMGFWGFGDPASSVTSASALGTPSCGSHLGRARTRRSHCQSHNSQGALPLDAAPSSPAPPSKRYLFLPYWTQVGKKWKKHFFSFWTGLYFLPVPCPSRPSTAFVQIILPSKRTGVSLKGSRRNWQETVPGEEKVNQLFKINCNKWHFNRLMKHVQQSIIQLSAKSDTLSDSSSIYNKCIN